MAVTVAQIQSAVRVAFFGQNTPTRLTVQISPSTIDSLLNYALGRLRQSMPRAQWSIEWIGDTSANLYVSYAVQTGTVNTVVKTLVSRLEGKKGVGGTIIIGSL